MTTLRDKARSLQASVLLLEERARLLRRGGKPSLSIERQVESAAAELLVLLLDLEPEAGEHPLEIYAVNGTGPDSRQAASWWLLEASRGSPGISFVLEPREGSWRVMALVEEVIDVAIVTARRIPIHESDLGVSSTPTS